MILYPWIREVALLLRCDALLGRELLRHLQGVNGTQELIQILSASAFQI